MPNVTEQGLQSYLKVFHEAYTETVESLVPAKFRSRLLRQALLPAEIIGYVSTQFGVAYEYGTPGVLQITTTRSSRRIEDLVLAAPPFVRRRPEMFRMLGSDATIAHLTLAEGFPFRLGNEADQIRFIDVRVKIEHWSRILRYAEFSAIRMADHWSAVRAVARAKDEILEAVVDLGQLEVTAASELSDYLNIYKPKRVLVLGDFGREGRQRLADIKAALADMGYSPLTVDEVPDVAHFDLLQKLVAIASSSRFVVMDDSSRSGHLTEFDEVAHGRWHTIILRLKGSHSSFMTRGIASSLKTMVEAEYEASSLPAVLADAVKQLETRIDEREAALRATLPWSVESG